MSARILPDTPQSAAPPAGLGAALALTSDERAQLDALILGRLGSDVALVNQVAKHIVSAGGKRLRPLIVLLAAQTLGYRGQHHVHAAAIVELIHTATLLHDDVVDESALRRGRDTANALFGNASSVLVGDFLYSRAFQMMVELERPPVMALMANTTNRIAEGEVMQLMHIHNPDVEETAYLDVIARKTAVLFEAAARLGAMVSDAPPRIENTLGEAGRALGFAFQIADDWLDYAANDQALGKHLGADLAEGKATLPMIRALAVTRGADHALLRQTLIDGDVARLADVVAVIKACGALDYARQSAQRYAEHACAALASMPASPARDALAAVARYSVDRDH